MFYVDWWRRPTFFKHTLLSHGVSESISRSCPSHCCSMFFFLDPERNLPLRLIISCNASLALAAGKLLENTNCSGRFGFCFVLFSFVLFYLVLLFFCFFVSLFVCYYVVFCLGDGGFVIVFFYPRKKVTVDDRSKER